MIQGYFKNFRFYTAISILFAFLLVGCGAGSQELSRGAPLEDQLVNFNLATQSGDEETALKLIAENDRATLSDDGITFSEKYKVAIKRLRMSTLQQNEELALDGDGLIVGMPSVLESASNKGRHVKFKKRMGVFESNSSEEDTEKLAPLSSPSVEDDYSSQQNTQPSVLDKELVAEKLNDNQGEDSTAENYTESENQDIPVAKADDEVEESLAPEAPAETSPEALNPSNESESSTVEDASDEDLSSDGFIDL